MAKLQADLKELIELLNSHKVDYLIVGGHAVAFHGHVQNKKATGRPKDLTDVHKLVAVNQRRDRADS